MTSLFKQKKTIISISTIKHIIRKTSSLVSCFSECINFKDNEASDATLIKQMQIWIVLFEFQINGIIIYEIHPLSHKQISNYRRILELIIIMHVQYLFLFSSSSMLYGLGLAMIWLWNTYKHEIIHKKGFLKHISRPPWLAQPQYLHCSTTAKHTIGDKIIRAEEVNDFDGRQQSSTVGRWPGAKSSPQSEKATCNAGQQKTL